MFKKEIVKKFENIQKEIKEKNKNIVLALCEICGKRWSFIKGDIFDLLPFSYKIQISKDFGISIFYDDFQEMEEYKKYIKDFF